MACLERLVTGQSAEGLVRAEWNCRVAVTEAELEIQEWKAYLKRVTFQMVI